MMDCTQAAVVPCQQQQARRVHNASSHTAISHKPVPVKTYKLTPAGEKALKNKADLAFCAGHWQVKEVANFTEPGKAIDGAARSTVQFTYAAVRIPVMPGHHSDSCRPVIPVYAGRGGEAVWIGSW